jgi:hypothetical protein
MNWKEAMVCMREGSAVRRQAHMTTVPMGETEDGIPIICGGEEGIRLMTAWTDDDKVVSVFVGNTSKVFFVPGDEHHYADDWVIVGKKTDIPLHLTPDVNDNE